MLSRPESQIDVRQGTMAWRSPSNWMDARNVRGRDTDKRDGKVAEKTEEKREISKKRREYQPIPHCKSGRTGRFGAARVLPPGLAGSSTQSQPRGSESR